MVRVIHISDSCFSIAPRCRPALTSSFAPSPAMDPENPPPPLRIAHGCRLAPPSSLRVSIALQLLKFRACDTVLKNTEEMAQTGTPLPANREINSAKNILFIKNVELLVQ